MPYRKPARGQPSGDYSGRVRLLSRIGSRQIMIVMLVLVAIVAASVMCDTKGGPSERPKLLDFSFPG